MHFLKPALPLILVATLASADATATSIPAAVNMACATDNCYENCSADSFNNDTSIRQQNCDSAQKSTLPSSLTVTVTSGLSSTVSSTTPTATATASHIPHTGSNDLNNGTDSSNPKSEDEFREGHPSKSYSGLEANSVASPKEGGASSNGALTWVNLLGLGLMAVL